MSRPVVSNRALVERFRHLQASAVAARHRALIVVEESKTVALQRFSTNQHAPFVAATDSPDRSDRIAALLGQEFQLLVHETHEPVDASLLAALAGTLRAGGLLVLGVPFTLSADSPRRSAYRSSQRLSRILLAKAHAFPDKVAILSGTDLAETFSDPDCSYSNDTLPTTVLGNDPLFRTASSAPGWIAAAAREQDTLFNRARDFLSSHPRGCIILTGRRGRGKSGLLARLALWCHDIGRTHTVTAAHPSALSTLFRHSVHKHVYQSPEACIDAGTGTLLVDEAGSLPLGLLTRFLDSHESVVFCTTTEGYESTGRAFALRFAETLRQHRQEILLLEPLMPWRWDADDPLEQLVDDLLLRDANNLSRKDTLPACRPGIRVADRLRLAVSPIACDEQVIRLHRDQLTQDDTQLGTVFGLLRDTHYQTNATDLAHLLDGPYLQLWVLQRDARIVAALLLGLEGGIEPSLHDAIVSKQRRLPHQLLPQLLAQCANHPQALDARYARVIRIAVLDDVRRQGLGSQLLSEVETNVTDTDKVDAIGASFASDEASIAFWQANGYSCFHTGYRLNPRTGKRAHAVIKSYARIVSEPAELAEAIHDDNQQWRQRTPSRVAHSSMDRALLQRFADNQRTMHDTYAALSRLLQHHAIDFELPVTADPTSSTTTNKPRASKRQQEAELRKIVTGILHSSHGRDAP